MSRRDQQVTGNRDCCPHLDCLEPPPPLCSHGEAGWCEAAVWVMGVTMISTVLILISIGRDCSRVSGMCIRISFMKPLLYCKHATGKNKASAPGAAAGAMAVAAAAVAALAMVPAVKGKEVHPLACTRHHMPLRAKACLITCTRSVKYAYS